MQTKYLLKIKTHTIPFKYLSSPRGEYIGVALPRTLKPDQSAIHLKQRSKSTISLTT